MSECKLTLLVNLGSPNALSTKSIRLFLKNFLSDARVVDLPKILWYPILYGIILPFRAKKLLHKYDQIWLKKQNLSPLIHYTNNICQNLSHKIQSIDSSHIVKSAFAYSSPNITDTLNEVIQQYTLANIKSITIIPLYPQYSSTTTASVFDIITKYFLDKKYIPTMQFINSFHANEYYINAVVQNIKLSWQNNDRGEKLIMSYHSLPVKVIKDGDTYYNECIKTSELIANKLHLTKDDYKISFQSKFGTQKWLTPSTTDVIKEYAKSNIKSIDIICPGFMCDCLETLEEIKCYNKEIFLQNGGDVFNYIPCINDDDTATSLLLNLSSLS